MYLEVVFGFDIDLFFNVFYWMVSWRGLFIEVILDNGINFVGGNNEFMELGGLFDYIKI